MPTPMDAINRAIERCGGDTQLARALGLRRSAVSNWRYRGVVPVEQAIRVAQLGLGVTVHDLRPDLFGPPPRGPGVERRSGRERRRGERRRGSQ